MNTGASVASALMVIGASMSLICPRMGFSFTRSSGQMALFGRSLLMTLFTSSSQQGRRRPNQPMHSDGAASAAPPVMAGR